MDGLTLLHEAQRAGLAVRAEGERLRIRGPRRAEPLVRRLIARKAELLPLLRTDPDALPGDWRFEWEERAAIMEYDGNMPREHAEAAALVEVLGRMASVDQRATVDYSATP